MECLVLRTRWCETAMLRFEPKGVFGMEGGFYTTKPIGRRVKKRTHRRAAVWVDDGGAADSARNIRFSKS